MIWGIISHNGTVTARPLAIPHSGKICYLGGSLPYSVPQSTLSVTPRNWYLANPSMRVSSKVLAVTMLRAKVLGGEQLHGT